MNYYNEFDPKAAAWLRELINAGHIPQGEVDTRSITEVSPNDLKGFIQCHFFAGIAGWPFALHLAGVDSAKPLWTGSCPCQPFSVAGKGLGTADERHLWPVFADLIRECRPPAVLGEQVASRAGREWLAGVFADLEGMGYAVAGADLCAAGVGAPHIRQRLYWVADTEHAERRQKHGPVQNEQHRDGGGREKAHGQPGACGSVCGVADADRGGFGERGECDRDAPQPGLETPYRANIGGRSDAGRLGDTNSAGLSEQRRAEPIQQEQPALELRGNAWASFDLLPCTDGKTRRIESGSFPLAHGIPGRVGLLRGYGNAIVPQVAAAFIKAALI